MVCNDPAIAAEIRAHFIPVVADDVTTLRVSDGAPRSTRLIRDGLMQLLELKPDLVDEEGLPVAQGFAVMTAGGRLLDHMTAADKSSLVDRLRRSRRRYRELPEAVRVGTASFEAERPTPSAAVPPGMVQLDVVRRTLSPDGLSPEDYRHPLYFHLGRVWIRPEEVAGLVPSDRRLGARRPLPPPLARRILLRFNLTPEYVSWFGGRDPMTDTHVELEVVELHDDGAVTLRLDGPVVLETPRRRPDGRAVGRYEGRVAGRITVAPDRRALTAARFVVAGRLRHDHPFGGPDRTEVGALFTLGVLDREAPVFPAEYTEGYFE